MPTRATWLRALSWLLLAGAACAFAVFVASHLTGRTILALGSWRLTAHDPWRPLAVALGCLGCGGLLVGGWSTRPAVRMLWCALIATAVALALAIALRDVPRSLAVGDAAVAELYVLHVLRRTWMLGPYSQYYWHHPGPMMFHALAPLYAAAEYHAAALGLGALLINGGAVAASTWIAARRLPVAVSVGVCLATSVWIARTPGLMASYWNPHLIVLPMALYFWLTVAVSVGRPGLLPAVVMLGSFLVQTHIGAAPVVIGLAALATGLAWGDARHHRERASMARWGRAINASAWAAAILWALPLAEELAGPTDGNFTMLARFFWDRRGGGQDLAYSASAWASALAGAFDPQFRQPIGWTVSGEPHPVALAAAIAQMAGLVFVAWRGRLRGALPRAAGLAAAATLIVFIAITRIPGEVHDHALFWMGILGALSWGIVVGAVVDALAPAVSSRAAFRGWLQQGAAITIIMSTLILVLGGLAFVRAFGGRPTGSAADVAELSPAMAKVLTERRVARPFVRIEDDVWMEAVGTLLQLYRQDHMFSVEPRWGYMYGAPLAARGCSDAPVLHFGRRGRAGGGEVVARSRHIEVRLEPLPPPCGRQAP